MDQALRRQRNESLSSIATDSLREQFEDVKEKMTDIAEIAKSYTDEFSHKVERHPFYSVLGASAVGFVFGALLARK